MLDSLIKLIALLGMAVLFLYIAGGRVLVYALYLLGGLLADA